MSTQDVAHWTSPPPSRGVSSTTEQDAIAWVTAYERIGGRIWTDGRMFAITPPAEIEADLDPPADLMAVVLAAYRRQRNRPRLEP